MDKIIIEPNYAIMLELLNDSSKNNGFSSAISSCCNEITIGFAGLIEFLISNAYSSCSSEKSRGIKWNGKDVQEINKIIQYLTKAASKNIISTSTNIENAYNMTYDKLKEELNTYKNSINTYNTSVDNYIVAKRNAESVVEPEIND